MVLHSSLMVAGVEESGRIRRGCCEGERKICFKANMEVHDLIRARLVTCSKALCYANQGMTRPKTW
ncbi:hypothetical protein CMEL01_16437 [Colletotrichum melonis]|uniref:Uncharacterized protein n=1 Tax=Colletotrichum melonis TaxID=1209925 RepID=A0AAI9UDL9_9PEZI|nr:hypothetical protein CMEL01_16437 [Colletotrichum melonis]